jgi:hypothetical protein
VVTPLALAVYALPAVLRWYTPIPPVVPLTWDWMVAPTGKPPEPLTVSPIEIKPVLAVTLTTVPKLVTVAALQVFAALRL